VQEVPVERCSKRVPRVKGKGLDDPCLVCGEKRFTERAHFPTRKRKGEEGKDTIPLCPTHHRLLEFGRLSKEEYQEIMRSGYGNQFSSVEEFIQWAYDNCYPYDLGDLKIKFWEYKKR